MASLERLGRVFGVLDDATRRAVYAAVVARGAPASREDVAGELGISRTLAAFHLDKLADRGLLTVTYARPSGRAGPGAGRPAKMYERSDLVVEGSLPARRYDLAGSLLAVAVASARPSESAAEAAVRVARERGVSLGAAAAGRRRGGARATLTAARAVLAELGYEPSPGGGEVTLRNCPFHEVMEAAPGLVCGMNAALLAGVLEGLGGAGVDAVLDPAPGRCCVVLRART